MKKLDQLDIKSNNIKTIFSLIRACPGISRTEIARHYQLSKTTVSGAIAELQTDNFVRDTSKGKNEISVGRKPIGLEICAGFHYVLVISWFKDKILSALVDLSGNIGLQRSDIIADNHEYFNETLTIIMDAQKNYGTQILGVCIVIPAMISQFTEKIYSTSLDFSDEDAHWAFMQLQRMDVGYPVTVLNDTACIAYAEKIYTHIPDKNYVYIFFDRGIGATIFIDDKMIGRANGSFTQFGHISIDRNGRLCQCGNRGCIENYICESNLSTLYKELDPSASCLIASYAELKKLVDAGDQTAIRVISNISEELAQVLRNVICLVNPSLIVLGGKSRDLGESFIELLQDELHRQGFAQMTDYVTVRFNILNDQALYVGAMRYHFDTYYNFIKLNEKQVEFG